MQIPDYRKGVVVARYPGVTTRYYALIHTCYLSLFLSLTLLPPSISPRATSFAERLRLSLAVIHGEVKDQQDGRNSPPPDEHTPRRIRTLISLCHHLSSLFYFVEVARKEKPPLNVVGDVQDLNAFIIVSGGRPFVSDTKLLTF